MTAVVERAREIRRLPSPAAPVAPATAGAPPTGWVVDVAVAVSTVLTLQSLHRILSGSTWIGPALLVVVGAHLVCALTARFVRPAALGMLVDAVAATLLTIWAVVPSSTAWGLPLGRTWRAVDHLLTGLPARIQATTVPAPAIHAFVLLAVAGAAVVSVLASWLVVRLERPLTGMVPSLAGFVVCCCVGAAPGRTAATIAELVGLGVVLAATSSRRADPKAPPWLDPPAPGAAARWATGAVVIVAAGAVAAAAVVAHLPGTDGRGPLGWHASSADSQRIVISPLVSLRTQLLDSSNAPVFRVTSSEASYWRLTSLDSFDGTQWGAKDTYQRAGGPLAGAVGGPGTRRVAEHFVVAGLSSAWLPLAFDPERVTGAGTVSWDARSGSLLTSRPTSNGLRYTVESVQYLSTLSPRRLAAAAPVDAAAARAYLQLPATIPADVRALADRIVDGKRTEYAKAVALQDYFLTPRFTYSLHPASDGSGLSALQTFLFDTRTGYCQQFAGSFAVLARIVGLPTRLAVGFTNGTATSPGTYEVTDADAHTWPEVEFPNIGWVPFEPTKGAPGNGFAIPGATSYTGPTAAVHRPSSSAPRTAPTTPPVSAPTTGPSTPGLTSPTTVTAPSIGHRLQPGGGRGAPGGTPTAPSGPRPATGASIAGAVVVWILAGAAAVVVALAVGNTLRRRERWSKRRRRPGPDLGSHAARTLAAWDEVQETLAWHGVVRSASETQGEFTHRAARDSTVRHLLTGRDRDAATDLVRLGEIATTAAFGGPVSAELAVEADVGARRLRSALGARAALGLRVRLLLDPRLSWGARPAHPG